MSAKVVTTKAVIVIDEEAMLQKAHDTMATNRLQWYCIKDYEGRGFEWYRGKGRLANVLMYSVRNLVDKYPSLPDLEGCAHVNACGSPSCGDLLITPPL